MAYCNITEDVRHALLGGLSRKSVNLLTAVILTLLRR
jgi:hypothetical protein